MALYGSSCEVTVEDMIPIVVDGAVDLPTLVHPSCLWLQKAVNQASLKVCWG